MFLSDLIHPNSDLQDKLHALYGLSGGQKIDLSFRKPYLDLLEKFGNPHLSLPPVIHVAGTNGKGSTIAFMRAILEAVGHKVHVYTSPHLVRFNERIVLAGEKIDDGYLEDLIDEALQHNGNESITFFEITTAIAFAAFSRAPADIVLLEVGMGGRLDCTNIIPNAAVSVVTPVSIDHTEFLGKTLEDIAFEKASIMKNGVPCVVGAQENAALNMIRKTAQKMNVELSVYGDDYEWNEHYPTPNLMGVHQLQNAATAITALRIWGDSIADEDIVKGMQHVEWRGRLQDVSDHFSDLAGWDIWYDGGHNEAAGKALAAQIKTWRERDGKETHLIIGMMPHKDPEGFLRAVLPHVTSVRCVPIAGVEESNILHNTKFFLNANSPLAAEDFSSIQEAVHSIQNKEKTSRILITGSLYLAQEIFSEFTRT